MKILLVNHFPLEGSGSGTYTKNIAMNLVKREHEVAVVLPENDSYDKIPGVNFFPVFFTNDKEIPNALPFNFPCFTTHPRSTTTFTDLSTPQFAQYLTAFDSVMRQTVETFKPDIIHGQHIWCLSWLGAKQGVPSVITTHGTDIMGCTKWPEFKGFASESISVCSKVIAISNDNMISATSMFPHAKEKTILLSNGYNEDIFYPEQTDREDVLSSLNVPYNGEKLVLFAGKLTEFKGVDTLLRAAALYEKETNGDIVTLLAGNGEKFEYLNNLKDELGLKKVYFLGHKSQDELRTLYSTADVFAMPSRREPFGLVAIEAMACGLPVVATEEGGLPEFVKPEVGSLVPVDDEASLSMSIFRELK